MMLEWLVYSMDVIFSPIELLECIGLIVEGMYGSLISSAYAYPLDFVLLKPVC